MALLTLYRILRIAMVAAVDALAVLETSNNRGLPSIAPVYAGQRPPAVRAQDELGAALSKMGRRAGRNCLDYNDQFPSAA